jgi:hypothetical protein
MSTALAHPEHIHPSLWLAAQLARGVGRTVDTGYPALSRELPGGGWPRGALVDLLLQQSGIGELRLLAPALASIAQRPIALLQPPQDPNAHGLSYIGLRPEKLLMIRTRNTSDALWSAEQVLKTGSCAALLMWGNNTCGPNRCVAFIWLRNPARRCCSCSGRSRRLLMHRQRSSGSACVQTQRASRSKSSNGRDRPLRTD